MLFVFNKPTLFEKEKKMSRKGKGSSNTEQFGEEKRKISEIHDIVTSLKDQIKALKKELLETKQELKEIKTENKK